MKPATDLQMNEVRTALEAADVSEAFVLDGLMRVRVSDGGSVMMHIDTIAGQVWLAPPQWIGAMLAVDGPAARLARKRFEAFEGERKQALHAEAEQARIAEQERKEAEQKRQRTVAWNKLTPEQRALVRLGKKHETDNVPPTSWRP